MAHRETLFQDSANALPSNCQAWIPFAMWIKVSWKHARQQICEKFSTTRSYPKINLVIRDETTEEMCCIIDRRLRRSSAVTAQKSSDGVMGTYIHTRSSTYLRLSLPWRASRITQSQYMMTRQCSDYPKNVVLEIRATTTQIR
jgi:hypothetical protein